MQLIMARTGHSSTDGVRAYKRESRSLKQFTSNVLNGQKPGKTEVADEEAEPEPKKRVAFHLTRQRKRTQIPFFTFLEVQTLLLTLDVKTFSK